MIEAKNLTKSFGKFKAVNHIDVHIKENAVFGLIGTNGAGKSTFLRMISGVLKPDEGELLVDGEPIFDNARMKENIFFVPDDHYYYVAGTPRDMMEMYAAYYPKYDQEKWNKMMENFHLSPTEKIGNLSKGMKKQISIILGVCANTKYLICDETFDGLDPVMRQGIKSVFAKEMDERGLTPIIASHNLRELEDICEYVGLLHRGGILLESDLDEMKMGIHKLQCVVKDPLQLENMKEKLKPVLCENRGSLYVFTVRGDRDEIENYMETQNLVFYELLPLSLEEIFICETEVKGYDVKELLY